MGAEPEVRSPYVCLCFRILTLLSDLSSLLTPPCPPRSAGRPKAAQTESPGMVGRALLEARGSCFEG